MAEKQLISIEEWKKRDEKDLLDFIYPTGQYQPVCTICSVKYPSINGLATHLVKDHNRKPLWQCPVCSKELTKHHVYSKHIRNVHRINHPLRPVITYTNPDPPKLETNYFPSAAADSGRSAILIDEQCQRKRIAHKPIPTSTPKKQKPDDHKDTNTSVAKPLAELNLKKKIAKDIATLKTEIAELEQALKKIKTTKGPAEEPQPSTSNPAPATKKPVTVDRASSPIVWPTKETECMTTTCLTQEASTLVYESDLIYIPQPVQNYSNMYYSPPIQYGQSSTYEQQSYVIPGLQTPTRDEQSNVDNTYSYYWDQNTQYQV